MDKFTRISVHIAAYFVAFNLFRVAHHSSGEGNWKISIMFFVLGVFTIYIPSMLTAKKKKNNH